jgi:glyoxylase-like metal-dependent hydrolase (beta-lactamase superfamily II)
VRARALHPDAIVLTSAVLHVNSVLLRGHSAVGEGEDGPLRIVEAPAGVPAGTVVHGETFLIDSPVLPDELQMLPAVLEQARFPPLSGLLATHADWDHLLGRLAFPEALLGCAESSAERLRADPGAAQRELRSFDEGLYLERPAPLALGAVQPLPVPGHCEIGELELELHPTGGHTADGMALWAAWAGVLVVGDYLSAIELPMLSPGGGIAAYLATLERLQPLVAVAEHVIPGHGPVLDSERATAILEEDRAYLQALSERGAEAELPPARRSREQRAIHERNVAELSPSRARS